MIKVLNISFSIDFTSSEDKAEDETAIVAITPALQPTTDSNSRNPLVIWFASISPLWQLQIITYLKVNVVFIICYKYKINFRLVIFLSVKISNVVGVTKHFIFYKYQINHGHFQVIILIYIFFW